MWFEHHNRENDWMGFATDFPHCLKSVQLSSEGAAAPLSGFLAPQGDRHPVEPVEGKVSWRKDLLAITVLCHDPSGRVSQKPVAVTGEPARDQWGQDAIEIQVDPWRDGREYLHFMIPLNGQPTSFRAANNRVIQGYTPAFSASLSRLDHAWQAEVDIPFSGLGKEPEHGDIWGFNLFRANPVEADGYVQWVPTWGVALSPELFGHIRFSDRTEAETLTPQSFPLRVERRFAAFQKNINGLSCEETLQHLPVPDWESWALYFAQRSSPRALGFGPHSQTYGRLYPELEGLRPEEHVSIMEDAEAKLASFRNVASDGNEAPSMVSGKAEALGGPAGLFSMEAVGTAWLLTRDTAYAELFTHLIREAVHYFDCHLPPADKALKEDCSNKGCYHDSQILKIMTLAYVYTAMREAPIAPDVHAEVMRMILRACRYAAFHISNAYIYGNHQLYESAGLICVAAMFPEFKEQKDWAMRASRAIRLHLTRELYPDGGYYERCGYHCDVLRYVSHALRTVEMNGQEPVFEELCASETRQALARMADWQLKMCAPDGSMPAFGDNNAPSILAELQRSAFLFNRPDMLWPVKLSPRWRHRTDQARKPDFNSLPLDSGFTVMRDGWDPGSFYIALDHGPLGGQHSHCDSMGFCAFAHGLPIALDCGIGSSYEDGMYVEIFRPPEAHNVIVIDGIEPEKVSQRTAFRSGAGWDSVTMLGHEYARLLGILHERTVFFAHGTGWIITDRLWKQDGTPLGSHEVKGIINTPFPMRITPNGAYGFMKGVELHIRALPRHFPLVWNVQEAKAAIPTPPTATSVFNRTGTVSRLYWKCQSEGMSKLEMTLLIVPVVAANRDASAD